MAALSGSFPKFKLRPSSNGVGPFTLGSKISEVFAYLKKNQAQYPNNAFYFNQVDPMSMDYVIELLNCGVSLRFNPILQRLTSVRFSRMDEVDLLYPRSGGSSDTFSYPSRIATLIHIYTVFGPTTFGHFEDNYRHYVLEYPGLAFVFEVPQDKSVFYANGASLPNTSNELPSELYTIPLISLYCRPKDKDGQITTLKEANSALDKEPYVQVSRGESITFCFPSTSTSTTLVFGSHVQRVVEALGLPQQRFTKQDTPLITSRNSHASHEHSQSTILPEPDYFFNYFDLGVDILFDGKLHVVKKFVLWTNLPSQPDFVRYSKCHYTIETRGMSRQLNLSSSEGISQSKLLLKRREDDEKRNDEKRNDEQRPHHEKRNDEQQPHQQQPHHQQPHHQPPHQHPPHPNNHGDDDEEIIGHQPPQDELRSPKMISLSASASSLVPEQITPQMRWPQIEEIMGPPSGNPYWYPASSGAFGGMTYYAYPNIIFEVMKKDEYVSKIFLFPG